jgi:hypothetical protein
VDASGTNAHVFCARGAIVTGLGNDIKGCLTTVGRVAVVVCTRITVIAFRSARARAGSCGAGVIGRTRVVVVTCISIVVEPTASVVAAAIIRAGIGIITDHHVGSGTETILTGVAFSALIAIVTGAGKRCALAPDVYGACVIGACIVVVACNMFRCVCTAG